MKLGFIGMGSMGTAIARGALEHGFVAPTDLFFTTRSQSTQHPLTQDFAVSHLQSNSQLLQKCQLVVLAVKPKQLPALLSEIRGFLDNHLVISVAGGVSVAQLQSALSPEVPVIRAMPNINALVGQSMTAICPAENVTSEQKQTATQLFSSVGEVMELEEPQFGAFTALAGCAPAWTFAYVEALSRAGVAAGLSKSQASAAATQMLLGSAKMLASAQSQNTHPGTLIDQVCSPGGSTIAGLLAGEEAGFSASVVRMVQAAISQDAQVARVK